jgi:hypothetical protein
LVSLNSARFAAIDRVGEGLQQRFLFAGKMSPTTPVSRSAPMPTSPRISGAMIIE